jgi:hypothetical protein
VRQTRQLKVSDKALDSQSIERLRSPLRDVIAEINEVYRTQPKALDGSRERVGMVAVPMLSA